MLKIVKYGELFSSGHFTQYPTPQVLKDRLRLFYTNRIDNKSISSFVDVDLDKFSVMNKKENILQWGRPGEFDEDGCAIQFVSHTTAWYTGYAKRGTTPYQTMIGTAELQKSGEYRKTGICMGLSRFNPLSVCTPCVTTIDNHPVFFYNTHTSWDTTSPKVEAFYIIKGQIIQDMWSPVIEPYKERFAKGGSDHSYARPWHIKFNGRDIISYCYRDNYGHREDPEKGYRTAFYDYSSRKNLPSEQVNMEEDKIVAYLTSCNIKDKIYVFYNNAYNSGIQYGELIDE